MIYVGFDHHKNFSYVTIMDEKGQILKQQKIANDKSTLSQFMNLSSPCTFMSFMVKLSSILRSF